MPLMTGRETFLALLRQEGIGTVFGNPGTTELPLIAALTAAPDIRYVLGLHEGVVLAMADGYAQASGRPALVNLHAAPGLGNALGMLYDAERAGAPLLVTAGQHGRALASTEPALWGDLVRMARPFVKFAAEVPDLAQLPRLLHRAVTTALAPPTGPVFLSLPMDVLDAEADIALGAPSRVAPLFRADAEAVRQAATLLAAAARPAVIAGNAVSQSGALAELAALVELLGAPVFLESMAHTNVFPTRHPLFHSALTRAGADVRAALDPYDVNLSDGGDLVTLLSGGAAEALPPAATIIHLDTDPWQLGKNRATAVGLLGDPRSTLPELSAAVAAGLDDAGRARAAARGATAAEQIAAQRASIAARAEAEARHLPLRPLALMRAIGETLPDDAVVVDETISSGAGLRTFLKSQDRHGYFGVRGGGIGWSLPAAIGIKLALPQRPVVALTGDGSAMYAIQALWTAARERVAVIFVILNNRGYRILRQRLGPRSANRFPGFDLDDPAIDFVGLARAQGVAAAAAGTLEELVAALRHGLAGNTPLLIEVALDPA